MNVNIYRSTFYGNVVFHLNNSLDIQKQSLYISCQGFIRQAKQFQENLRGRLSILVTTQVVLIGSSLIYIQFISRTKSGRAMKQKFSFFNSLSFSEQSCVSANLGLFSLAAEQKPVIFKFSYFQKFWFLLKEHIWYE